MTPELPGFSELAVPASKVYDLSARLQAAEARAADAEREVARLRDLIAAHEAEVAQVARVASERALREWPAWLRWLPWLRAARVERSAWHAFQQRVELRSRLKEITR